MPIPNEMRNCMSYKAVIGYGPQRITLIQIAKLVKEMSYSVMIL